MTARGLETCDLSGRGLCKLDSRALNGSFQCLILDRNELTRLENIEAYNDKLCKLSASENKLVRMYGVCRLLNLRELDLSKNSIVVIEGLRELVHLRWLNLSGNRIKAIEHLATNVALERLDLSNNCIATISDINKLKSLGELQLDSNNLRTLGNVQSHFPASLEVLSLTNNSIADLNQVSYLNEAAKLHQLSISGNPCIKMTGNVVGFDHRPFVLNWCQNVKNLDGYAVGSKESLKAEWLYSMGKGRHFQPGEHAELVDYLSSVCPLTTADNVMTAEDAKLTRILSKRRQHQQQLLEELVTSMTVPNLNSSPPKELNSTFDNRLNPHQLPGATSDTQNETTDDSEIETGAVGNEMSLLTESSYVPVPETMLSPDFRPVHVSPQCSLFDLDVDNAMTRSWDSNAFAADVMARSWDGPNFMTKSLDAGVAPSWLQRSSIPRKVASSSKHANRATRTSLTDSPILRRPTQVQRLQRSNRPVSLSPSSGRRPPSSSPKKMPVKPNHSSSDDSTDSDVSLSKLTLVKKAVELRLASRTHKQRQPAKKENVAVRMKTTNAIERAAIVVQAAWRGHRVRKSNSKAVDVRNEMRVRRTEDHICYLEEKLTETQRELEKEKRLRALQMEAIRSLWKEVQQIQGGDSRATQSDSVGTAEPQGTILQVDPRDVTVDKDNTAEMMQHLVTTCNTLQQQVQQLQETMHLLSAHLVVHSGAGEAQSKSPCVMTTDEVIPEGREERMRIESINNSSTMNGAAGIPELDDSCLGNKDADKNESD